MTTIDSVCVRQDKEKGSTCNPGQEKQVDSVLDFGCGCGRVTRYWSGFAGSVAGSDIDGPAVAWCRSNLAFARFEQNRLEPPLAFERESFDLVYALSVFTHLTGELQLAWRDELRRVLRPAASCSSRRTAARTCRSSTTRNRGG